jgi:hypothetical protein
MVGVTVVIELLFYKYCKLPCSASDCVPVSGLYFSLCLFSNGFSAPEQAYK